MDHNTLEGHAALITGGAKRIGASVARALHEAGINLALHYRSSANEARGLAGELNARRPDSVILIQGDLLDTPGLVMLVRDTVARWGRLDLLVNNASSFYPTPVGSTTQAQWDDLMGSNLKAPFFLAQAAAAELRSRRGNIVNMVDIYADRPMSGHPVYCAAKAGLAMLTKSLARELAPEVRVNGIAPGAILWPEACSDEAARDYIISHTALKRLGNPDDVARALLFLIQDANYVTGQIMAVDGGRSLFI
jgi:pteridine reductase